MFERKSPLSSSSFRKHHRQLIFYMVPHIHIWKKIRKRIFDRNSAKEYSTEIPRKYSKENPRKNIEYGICGFSLRIVSQIFFSKEFSRFFAQRFFRGFSSEYSFADFFFKYGYAEYSFVDFLPNILSNTLLRISFENNFVGFLSNIISRGFFRIFFRGSSFGDFL